jgi:uncharacterized protein (TIGR00255 family)
MTVSMTGFAARKGQGGDHSWVWDIRSVNGKGLDLRIRVPDWIDGLEQALRMELPKAMQRGNVSLSLKVSRDAAGEGAGLLRIDPAGLDAVLAMLGQIETRAMQAGVTLGQATAADVLTARGVLDMNTTEFDTAPLRAAILSDLVPLLAEFTAMRLAEGRALGAVISAQLDEILALTKAASQEAAARKAAAAPALREALQRVLDNAAGVDEARIAQELALIAVKNDVQEEIDRLTAHVAAAKALLSGGGAIGRKLDFLIQEFMREANTLCSKAQSLALTRIGLDLKTVIDQMREQVQNVE